MAVQQELTFDIADEVINDITEPQGSGRVSRSWDISYNTTSAGVSCPGLGGINTAPLDQVTINTCGDLESELTNLYLEIDQAYVLGDKLWELSQSYEKAMDVTLAQWELGQEYTFRQEIFELTQFYHRYDVQNLTELEVSQEYCLTGTDFADELLGMINDYRDILGLDPLVGVWTGEIDIAQTHSNNMGDTGIFAHDSLSFPVGWQTTEERVEKLVYVTGHEENLAKLVSSPAEVVMGNTGTYPSGASFMPLTAYDIFNGWVNSPVHRDAMVRVWEDDDFPVMALGIDTVNDPTYSWYISEYITAVFLGYGAPEDAKMYKFELSQEWSVASSLTNYLSQSYVLDARTPVATQHSTPYSIKVETQHVVKMGYTIQVQHSVPIHYTIEVRHTTPYSDITIVNTQHEITYDDTVFVHADHTTPYQSYPIVSAQHTITYDSMLVIDKQHGTPYQDLSAIQTQHKTAYQDTTAIATQHKALYTMLNRVANQLVTPYGNNVPIATQHSANWDILSVNPISVQHSVYWTIASDVQRIDNPEVKILIDGVYVPTLEVSISISEPTALWSCKAILADFTHFSKFVEGASFSIDMQGEVYEFTYLTRSVTRDNPGSVSIVVEGLSPAMVLQEPRAESIDRTYETDMLAQDLIEDILGISVTWELPIWMIPAYTVAADKAIPLDLASSIIQTVGGVLQSDPDGTLVARKKYLVDTDKYHTVTPDHTYTDLEDNLSTSESYEARNGYNHYRITDTDDTYGDTLEFIPEEDDSYVGYELDGELRAYPTPWRTSIDIETTDRGVIFLGSRSWTTRVVEDEIVEFRDGKANLSYIAESIEIKEWYSDTLTSITHKQYTSEISAGLSVNYGYGLARITYTVRYLKAKVRGVDDMSAQFVIENTED